MKPAPFDYYAPATLAEALALLETHGDAAKILAGGQSLVPLMNFRLAQPEALIDLNRVRELAYLKAEGDSIHIGAMLRQRMAETAPLIRDKCPILAEALGRVGHRAIRNRGTIGGTLAHGDPSSEVPTVFLALDGEVRIGGSGGERLVPLAELLLGPYMVDLQENEILLEARIPVLKENDAWSFLEISRRAGDFALVCVAVVLRIGNGGVCESARIALGGVAPTPVRATAAETQLAGKSLTESLLAEAAEIAVAAVDCDDEYHASQVYRSQLVRVYTQRALAQAWQRARLNR